MISVRGTLYSFVYIVVARFFAWGFPQPTPSPTMVPI